MRMATTPRKFVLMIPLAVAACWGEDTTEAPDDPVRTVRTIVAEQVDPIRVRSFPGVLEPPELTPLAFDVGGRLGALDLRVGQEVAEGDVIATVEAGDATLRLQQSEAQLSEAQIAFDNAAEEAERQEQLFARNVASQAARDRAVMTARQAEARVEQSRRNLDLLSESLSDTTLRAPFDGVVNSIEVQAFASVQPGQPIITLYEDEGLQSTVLVSYEIASTLTLGRQVAVSPTDGDTGHLRASVTEIARRAPAVSSFPIVVTLDETRSDLRSGMAVEVVLETTIPTARQGIPLPMSALAFDHEPQLNASPPRAEVFVYTADPGQDVGTVALRDVILGAVVGDQVFVVEGLDPGERVVTAGVSFLIPEQRVALEGGGNDSGDAPLDMVRVGDDP
ncbi:MAG: efflux RND transporter periplasmic adaptor subunit [Pseudomonadota bacterium]